MDPSFACANSQRLRTIDCLQVGDILRLHEPIKLQIRCLLMIKTEVNVPEEPAIINMAKINEGRGADVY